MTEALRETLGLAGLLRGSESPEINRTPHLCHVCVCNQQRHETAEHGIAGWGLSPLKPHVPSEGAEQVRATNVRSLGYT